MNRKLAIGLALFVAAFVSTASFSAEQPEVSAAVAAQLAGGPAGEKQPSETLAPGAANSAPAAAEAKALEAAIAGLPPGNTDEERNEREALASFYKARAYAPLWVTASGQLTPKAQLAIAEIGRAGEWGLDPRDFPVPAVTSEAADARIKAALPNEAPAAQTAAAAEIKLSLAILKYGRYARGGRIMDPSEQLSSYLDRKPQLLKPAAIMEGVTAADEPDAYLRSLHPPHPQFEQLRQKYLVLLNRGRKQSAEAKKLLANMEEWRWMPIDMGEFYIWNNIPEFMQRVVKNGQVIRKERIVAGETGKQTPIFSRALRKITFKPTWIVPDSIKVRELWPDLLRGGGLFRQWSLEVQTKDGQPLNWRKMNWEAIDIRQYEVIQPNGPKSVMGKFKFSFPNQHTVFMHDYLPRDKWMFNVARRTYSHGCMRVYNPLGLAQLVLREDKGWDAAEVVAALNTGPLNNEIALDHRFPVHLTYFTALVDDDGKLNTFPDVYGHERRIILALEGRWSQIVKGPNHLAPVELNLAEAPRRTPLDDDANDLPGWRRRHASPGGRGFLGAFFGED
ncbi:MAG TPA: L,D-transpeptidase family protein [Hyphomicrobiales bacterium]|nr:L,D-transpeptidase family protein [Hyphomicrobiales bacterium]